MKRFAPRRTLGRTGFTVTALGIGDLADRSAGLETCAATLRRALDAGLNLVDTAPSYEDGFSEEVVGHALRDRRDGVFVIDKVDLLDRPVAPQVKESVARLGFPPDAFVFHSVPNVTAWEALTARGGGFEQLAAAFPRSRGVSSHDPEVVARAIDSGLCDVVMFAVGPFVDARYLELVRVARERSVGTVCFKTFGAGKLVADSEGYGKPSSATGLPRLTVDECVHYTLTIDPDVALLGLSTPEEQDAAFAAAERFAPLDASSLESVRARATKAVEGKGRIWWDPS